MSLNAAVLRLMAAKGLTLADVAEIAEAMEVRVDRTAAARQQRRRDRVAAEAVTRDESRRDVTRDEPPTPNKSPPHPQKLTPTPGEHTHTSARGARTWKCPEGVEAQHWSDFLANRQRKRLASTLTAYRAQLRDLEKLADDEWPPGRIVQFAAERGWGAFFDPRGRTDGQTRANGMGGLGQPGAGASRTVGAALAFIADGEPN